MTHKHTFAAPAGLEPLGHVEPWTTSLGGAVYWHEGPSTGLPWSVEMVRLDCLRYAEWADERMAKFAAERREWAEGVACGEAQAHREAAAALIRRAWWRA